MLRLIIYTIGITICQKSWKLLIIVHKITISPYPRLTGELTNDRYAHQSSWSRVALFGTSVAVKLLTFRSVSPSPPKVPSPLHVTNSEGAGTRGLHLDMQPKAMYIIWAEHSLISNRRFYSTILPKRQVEKNVLDYSYNNNNKITVDSA